MELALLPPMPLIMAWTAAKHNNQTSPGPLVPTRRNFCGSSARGMCPPSHVPAKRSNPPRALVQYPREIASLRFAQCWVDGPLTASLSKLAGDDTGGEKETVL